MFGKKTKNMYKSRNEESYRRRMNFGNFKMITMIIMFRGLDPSENI